MPNFFKSSSLYNSGSLIKGGFNIGIDTSSVVFGPTSTTDFWNGITPPTTGYTVYQSKPTEGPSIRVASTDQELITMSLTYGGSNISTVGGALNYFHSQSTMLAVNQNYPNISTNGLVVHLDAGYTPNYPKTGTTWYNLSSEPGKTIMSGATVPGFSSSVTGSFNFTNINNSFVGSTNLTSSISTQVTIVAVINVTDVTQRSVIFSKYRTTNPTGFLLEAGTAAGTWTNTLRFYAAGYNGNSSDVRGQSNVITQSQKCMVGVTYNSATSGTTLYYNGIALSGSQSGVQSDSGWSTSPNNFSIGTYQPYFAIYSAMNLHNMLIYNRALTAAEMLELYNGQKSRFGI